MEREPCARCGTTGGPACHQSTTGIPKRTSGARFGITGSLCERCYHMLAQRHKIGVGRPRPVPPRAPCAMCGNPDGPLPTGATRPTRTDGRRFGIDGRLCRHCYGQLDYRAQRTGVQDPARG